MFIWQSSVHQRTCSSHKRKSTSGTQAKGNRKQEQNDCKYNFYLWFLWPLIKDLFHLTLCLFDSQVYIREHAVATKEKALVGHKQRETENKNKMTVSITFIYDFCGLWSKTFSTLPACEVPGSSTIYDGDGNELTSLLKRICVFKPCCVYSNLKMKTCESG